jgi:hypothetical protein
VDTGLCSPWSSNAVFSSAIVVMPVLVTNVMWPFLAGVFMSCRATGGEDCALSGVSVWPWLLLPGVLPLLLESE